VKLRRLRMLRASLLGRTLSQDRLRSDGAQIGRNVYLGDGVDIDASHRHLVAIEDDATLAPRVVVLAHDASTKAYLGYTRIGLVRIGRRCFIGAGSIILPGVTIGEGTVIGAGSVVTTSIPDHAVATGNPCRVVGSVDEFTQRRRAEMVDAPIWDAHGWTVATGLTSKRQAEQREALRNGFGYLQ
jgi:maltose O-acetyltransferase